MQDNLGRNINYIRVSITDRCNLRCRYCMPEEGLSLKPHKDILRLEEIARLIKIGADLGISKVRFTGGEPLIRRGLVHLISMVASVPIIDDIALTTNGLMFASMVDDLKTAGLNRVNISLDTLNAERYSYITRGGSLAQAISGLEAAIAYDLHPVKINTVVINGFNDDEVLSFCKLAYDLPVHVRFIEFMPVGELAFWQGERLLSADDIKTVIEEKYSLQPGKIGQGNGPAKYYNMDGGQGSIGFITPMSHHFCSECNRLRLTSDGKLRACLYNNEETDLQQALRDGLNDEEIKDLFIKTIALKPEKHSMTDKAWGKDNRKMYQIGG
ncbi:MAG: GTP 3',8-cyclase MoaA [Acidobacteriota bacterium]